MHPTTTITLLAWSGSSASTTDDQTSFSRWPLNPTSGRSGHFAAPRKQTFAKVLRAGSHRRDQLVYIPAPRMHGHAYQAKLSQAERKH